MLKVEGLSAHYGAIHAVRDVSLEVREGEIVTIVGPNGAGKTTLLRTLSGLHRASAGSVSYRDQPITNLDPHRIVRAGLTQVLQGRQVFDEMTVLQNLRMGAYHRADRSAQVLNRDLDEVYAYFPRLQERAQQKGGTLSGGEQVMLAIGRALMSKPHLLLLDEPSFGLAPQMVDAVFDALLELNRAGRTIVLVEQNAELAFDVAQRGYLMVLGRVVLTGSTAELRGSDAVIDLYLGQAASDEMRPHTPKVSHAESQR
jgi:branched-chain amino acid transport system ATP-binding protein